MSQQGFGEHFETIVIGGGQAGLSVGYHLQRRGQRFVILDGNESVGDSWRNRWDSLRLFTPAKYNGLDGMRCPAPRNAFITKDEMADYLESYARQFALPVRHGVRVERLSRGDDGRYVIRTGRGLFTADQVVVAMGHYQGPSVPSFATQLDPSIVQLHSIEYRSPSQLREGPVLLVGAGNSGAEIAKEVSTTHKTWLAGPDVGQIPFKTASSLGLNVFAPLVIRGVFHHLLTVKTPMGRKMRKKVLTGAGPLIRVRRQDLARLGVERLGRVTGVANGRPVVDGGRAMDVANVIWCTGFRSGFSWIDMPVLGEHEPNHRRGVATDFPGLYFVGLPFLYSMSSAMILGVGRDARYVAGCVAKRSQEMARERPATSREKAADRAAADLIRDQHHPPERRAAFDIRVRSGGL